MKELEVNLGLDFWRASCLWRKNVEVSLNEIGLTHPQFVVLHYLQNSGKTNICQKNLSDITGIDVATLSQIVRGLEKKSLLKRKHIKGDERAKYLKLTESGSALQTKAEVIYSEANLGFFRPLNNHHDNFQQDINSLYKGMAK